MSSQPDPEETILEAALDLPPEQRAAYLDQACRDNFRLRQLVEGLLKAHQYVATPARPPAATPLSDVRAVKITERAGDRIGRYKLLQQIGEGGYGEVDMAEQEQPVRRR